MYDIISTRGETSEKISNANGFVAFYGVFDFVRRFYS